MKLSLIVAVAEGGVIGHANGLPWHLPTDLRRFKQLTMGHHLLVGRKTFDAIGRALPGRHMVAISRGAPEVPAGVDVAHSLDEAIALARDRGDDEAFVAGGEEIYRLALPFADRVYLTRVAAVVEGDAWFPQLDGRVWQLRAELERPRDESNRYDITYRTFDRRRPDEATS